MPITAADIALAQRLADAAGAAIRPYFRAEHGVELKDDRSPVTRADREAEAAMRRLLDAEAHAFAEAIPAFQKAGATVIGMSADDVPTLQRFSAEKCAGKFAVASAGPAVIKNYDVALNAGGRALTKRTSYVIARDGKITFVHSDLSAADHVRLTLEAVRALK